MEDCISGLVRGDARMTPERKPEVSAGRPQLAIPSGAFVCKELPEPDPILVQVSAF